MITAAIYTRLANDATLTALLAKYDGSPAIFTTDPAPGDAVLPFIVTAGEAVNSPFDTKTTRGNTVWRDVRCYGQASGSAAKIEAIADRVRDLLHRQTLSVAGYNYVLSECSGPVVADEQDVYGRILTVKLTIEEV
jgi:hypothetical protein